MKDQSGVAKGITVGKEGWVRAKGSKAPPRKADLPNEN